MTFLKTVVTVIMRVAIARTRPMSHMVLKFLYLLFKGRTKPVPAIKDKILLLSATKLAEKIRKRQLICEDVMRAYIDRARLVQPYINAVVDERYAEALEESKEVDKFLERGEKSVEEIERDTPLLGVPFTCKESLGVKGLSQTAGIYRLKDRKAEKDSDATGFYRSAGAIPVTVTNVPQNCMWWDSSNYVYGTTENPFDHSRTVGGSTGGEGALLTTGGAVIGIGSDIAGSIRVPAAFNGLYGHKPTAGVVSNAGKFPENTILNHFVGIGPMCRYAEDLPLLLKTLSGNDQRLQLHTKVNFQNVKVYYLEEFPDLPAVPAVKKAIREATNFLEETFNIKSQRLNIKEFKKANCLWECKALEVGAPPFKLLLADESGKVNLWFELLKKFLFLSKQTLSILFLALIDKQKKNQFYFDILKQYSELEQKFNEIFKEDAILLFPTHPEPPPFKHLTIPNYLNVGYTAIFNVLGFPSTAIPAGLCDGLPLGIQAVSGHFKDHLTIAAAMELDKLFGGWITPCPIIASIE